MGRQPGPWGTAWPLGRQRVRQVTHSLLSHLVFRSRISITLSTVTVSSLMPDVIIGHVSHHGVTYLGFSWCQESLRRGSYSDDGHPPGRGRN